MNCGNCGQQTTQQGGKWVCMNCYWSSGFTGLAVRFAHAFRS